MKKIVQFIFTMVIFFLLLSCKTQQRDGLANNVGKFLANNDEVNLVLKININSLLNKTEILELPEFGFQLKETYDQLNRGAALSEHIYVVGSGAFGRDGMPSELTLFMAVENEEEISNLMAEMGYFFSEEGGYQIHEEDGMSLGYKNDLLIVVLSDNSKERLMSALNRVKNNKPDDARLKGLDHEGDLLLSMNLENLYATSNTDLNKLPIQHQERIKSLVKGSFVNTVVQFNAGEIIVDTYLDFNDDLQKAMFLAENGSSNALNYVGPGQPLVALSVNLDIEKMEELLLNSYPDALNELYKNMGPQGLILKAIGGGKIASYINGQFGMAVTGFDVDDKDQLPLINFYSGLGKSSSDIVELINAFAEDAGAQFENDGVISYDNYLIRVMNDAIVFSSNKALSSADFGKKSLDVPGDFAELLTYPVAFYMDFAALAETDADEYLYDASIALDYLDKLFFYADNTKARLVIKFDNKEDNVLKQSVDIALDSF